MLHFIVVEKFGHLQSVYFITDNCTTAPSASWYPISSLPYSQMFISKKLPYYWGKNSSAVSKKKQYFLTETYKRIKHLVSRITLSSWVTSVISFAMIKIDFIIIFCVTAADLQATNSLCKHFSSHFLPEKPMNSSDQVHCWCLFLETSLSTFNQPGLSEVYKSPPLYKLERFVWNAG